jgi:amidohydrolase
LKVGLVATKGGPILATTDNFTATFHGRGCHGAFPHLGRDPIVAACEAVVSLQHVVSREMDPTEPGVVTVGMVHAGTAVNVIPDVATISGTARALNEESRALLEEAIRRRVAAVGAAHDCRVEFEWVEGYPATVNDHRMAEYVAGVAREVLGENRFVPVARPAMGGEDFAYYLENVPGCFFFVGVEPTGRDSYPPLHSDLYDFTDEALGVGVRMFVGIVMRWGT